MNAAQTIQFKYDSCLLTFRSHSEAMRISSSKEHYQWHAKQRSYIMGAMNAFEIAYFQITGKEIEPANQGQYI